MGVILDVDTVAVGEGVMRRAAFHGPGEEGGVAAAVLNGDTMVCMVVAGGVVVTVDESDVPMIPHVLSWRRICIEILSWLKEEGYSCCLTAAESFSELPSQHRGGTDKTFSQPGWNMESRNVDLVMVKNLVQIVVVEVLVGEERARTSHQCLFTAKKYDQASTVEEEERLFLVTRTLTEHSSVNRSPGGALSLGFKYYCPMRYSWLRQ
jgi:hypothetical protein